ncbi:MAG: ATP synthase subunit I [Spongiibacteraceae bacterium]
MGVTPERPHTGAAVAKPPLWKLYTLQTGILLVICTGLLWIDTITAYSVLLGGLISIAPNSYFARQVFRYRGAAAARHIARAFYQGETGKFLLTATAFAVVFATVKPLDIVAFWGAYVAAALSHWLVAAYIGGFRRPAPGPETRT